MHRGIYAAVLTPITSSFEPDAQKAVAYYRDLLASGCDGLNLLGTTGEAMSFSANQRLRFMEAIARSGLPMERIFCGTGAASLDDAILLTRAAAALGFAAALVMPPFFYREVGDDGIVAFFDALLARMSEHQALRILLYNFPRMSGITFDAELVERLLREFPGIVVGMKDSSNDRDLQRSLLASHKSFAMFPGSEEYLAEAKGYGVTGCISGSVCLWPRLAQDVFRSGDPERARELATLRAGLAGAPFIPAVRRLVARERNDPAWEAPMPPLASGEHVL